MRVAKLRILSMHLTPTVLGIYIYLGTYLYVFKYRYLYAAHGMHLIMVMTDLDFIDVRQTGAIRTIHRYDNICDS